MCIKRPVDMNAQQDFSSKFFKHGVLPVYGKLFKGKLKSIFEHSLYIGQICQVCFPSQRYSCYDGNAW